MTLNKKVMDFLYDHILLIYDIRYTEYNGTYVLWVYYNLPHSIDRNFDVFDIESTIVAEDYIQLVNDLQKG